jgi:hypothetical protein
MYINKKITMWVQDSYNNEITLEELINDPDSNKGFIEREDLYETQEAVINDKGVDIIEIYSDDSKLLYSTANSVIIL